MSTLPRPENIPFKNIPKGSSSSGYVEKLILFLETHLSNFPKEKHIIATQSENDITSNLWIYLTQKSKFNLEGKEYPFDFHPEFPQRKPSQKGHSSRIDLAAFRNVRDQSMEVVYCLEAKKLPTPGSTREKEYVLGNKGGIERFKNEAHGLDDKGGLLANNGILAYVTDQSFEYWLNLINSWISDAGWIDSEKLTKDYFHPIGKLNSTHSRNSGDVLYLNHFWVKI